MNPVAAALAQPPRTSPRPHPDTGFRQARVMPAGMVTPGNIDLNHRPVVHNPDGSISTVRSITVTDDAGRAYLIPTVVGHRVVSNEDALRHFQQTGEHLGVFTNERMADTYAQQLHEAQARRYLPPPRARTSYGKPLT